MGIAVAIGICIALTALPVLVALLKEMKNRRLQNWEASARLRAMTDGVLWISVSALLIVSAVARGDRLCISL